MNVFGWLLDDRRASDGLFRECRRCGTTLEVVTVGCPTCGSTEIATYEV